MRKYLKEKDKNIILGHTISLLVFLQQNSVASNQKNNKSLEFTGNYHQVGKLVFKLTQNEIIRLLWSLIVSPYLPGLEHSILQPKIRINLLILI